MSRSRKERHWSACQSAELYQVPGWGEPFFSVNDDGHLLVSPDPRAEGVIDLYELTLDLDARGLDLPLLVRFSDILRSRIRLLNEAFEDAMEHHDYQGRYQGVFPVKVNQQRHLVEEVVEFGAPWHYGLEAGSKPELLVALAATTEPGSLIICNGFKDRAYIETALLAQRFDKTVLVVIERAVELDAIVAAYEKTGIRPALGIRAKLGAKGVGRWGTSTGHRAKFGLTAAEIVEVTDRLASMEMLDCLRLLHFHIGSQVSSILPIKNAMREAANLYVELADMGAAMGYLDVGGGLAVDYDGSKTDFHASKNYTVDEYAADIVATIGEACAKANVQVPTIVSESGRAVCAHQSVLVFEVVGQGHGPTGPPEKPGEDAPRVVRELYDTWSRVRPKNAQESYHDALQGRDEAESLFNFGYLRLRERAVAERLFWSCCERVAEQAKRLRHVPEEIAELEQAMARIYYCNFSVFQSAPDAWAIGQLFPVMPIHRLTEEPSVRASLVDITCDSDGKLDRFIDVEDEKHALEVHDLRPGERYFLAMFLNGAYQEILGDLHNLFGDTNAVHVRLEEDGGYAVRHVVRGDATEEVLAYVEHDPRAMLESVRLQAERAKRLGKITVDQVRLLLRHYEEALGSYTYLTGM